MTERKMLGDDLSEQTTMIDNGKDGNTKADLTVWAVIENKDGGYPKDYRKKEEKHRSSIKEKIKSIKPTLIKTFHKRNPITNGLLSVLLIGNTLVSFLIMMFSLCCGWTFAIAGVFYCIYCIYNMYEFTVANRKKALLYSWMGSIVVWTGVLFIYTMLTTPEPYQMEEAGIEDYTTDTEYFLISMGWSVVFNTLGVWLIRLIMKFKKYGVSAWSLLDVVHKRFRNKFEKVTFVLYFIIWLIPCYHVMYQNLKENHQKDPYLLHKTVKIGDYYYTDGTVTSDWLVDKTVAGVVFSLETSEADKAQGFVHGQIVAYSDLSDKKQSWDNGNHHDISEYPNYDWSNRLYALKDINGLGYMHCDGDSALPITLSCLHYLEEEPTQGISDWHVPTAGQWTKILENLGHVKVDRMLKFDADTASNNLDWIHLDPQRWYWTITEFDSDNAWSIRLKNGEFGSRSNKQNGAYVRPVASF